MAYYLRILSTSPDCVPLSTLQSALKAEKWKAILSTEAGDADKWSELVLSHANGKKIAAIERNLVKNGSPGAEELSEFAEEIEDAEPVAAAEWVLNYFPKVRTIYACQLLSGTGQTNGWEIFGCVKSALWGFAPSIIQADHEGFSNEEGFHILWQFSDDVSGEWCMGVMKDGRWDHFKMELGNQNHRAAFRRGEVPAGTKPL